MIAPGAKLNDASMPNGIPSRFLHLDGYGDTVDDDAAKIPVVETSRIYFAKKATNKHFSPNRKKKSSRQIDIGKSLFTATTNDSETYGSTMDYTSNPDNNNSDLSCQQELFTQGNTGTAEDAVDLTLDDESVHSFHEFLPTNRRGNKKLNAKTRTLNNEFNDTEDPVGLGKKRKLISNDPEILMDDCIAQNCESKEMHSNQSTSSSNSKLLVDGDVGLKDDSRCIEDAVDGVFHGCNMSAYGSSLSKTVEEEDTKSLESQQAAVQQNSTKTACYDSSDDEAACFYDRQSIYSKIRTVNKKSCDQRVAMEEAKGENSSLSNLQDGFASMPMEGKNKKPSVSSNNPPSNCEEACRLVPRENIPQSRLPSFAKNQIDNKVCQKTSTHEDSIDSLRTKSLSTDKKTQSAVEHDSNSIKISEPNQSIYEKDKVRSGSPILQSALTHDKSDSINVTDSNNFECIDILDSSDDEASCLVDLKTIGNTNDKDFLPSFLPLSNKELLNSETFSSSRRDTESNSLALVGETDYSEQKESNIPEEQSNQRFDEHSVSSWLDKTYNNELDALAPFNGYSSDDEFAYRVERQSIASRPTSRSQESPTNDVVLSRETPFDTNRSTRNLPDEHLQLGSAQNEQNMGQIEIDLKKLDTEEVDDSSDDDDGWQSIAKIRPTESPQHIPPSRTTPQDLHRIDSWKSTERECIRNEGQSITSRQEPHSQQPPINDFFLPQEESENINRSSPLHLGECAELEYTSTGQNVGSIEGDQTNPGRREIYDSSDDEAACRIESQVIAFRKETKKQQSPANEVSTSRETSSLEINRNCEIASAEVKERGYTRNVQSPDGLEPDLAKSGAHDIHFAMSLNCDIDSSDDEASLIVDRQRLSCKVRNTKNHCRDDKKVVDPSTSPTNIQNDSPKEVHSHQNSERQKDYPLNVPGRAEIASETVNTRTLLDFKDVNSSVICNSSKLSSNIVNDTQPTVPYFGSDLYRTKTGTQQTAHNGIPNYSQTSGPFMNQHTYYNNNYHLPYNVPYFQSSPRSPVFPPYQVPGYFHQHNEYTAPNFFPPNGQNCHQNYQCPQYQTFEGAYNGMKQSSAFAHRNGNQSHFMKPHTFPASLYNSVQNQYLQKPVQAFMQSLQTKNTLPTCHTAEPQKKYMNISRNASSLVMPLEQNDIVVDFLSPFEYYVSIQTMKVPSKFNKNLTIHSSLPSVSGKEINSASSPCDALRKRNVDLSLPAILKYESRHAVNNWIPEAIPERPAKDNDPELPACMTSIEHLSKKKFREDGLPIVEFAVYGGEDDILYYFKAFVQESGVPGAGFGAFLTYVGAKKLKPESKNLNDRLMADSEFRPKLEPQTLQADLDEGHGGVTVHLRGADLDRHGRQYCSTSNMQAYIVPWNFNCSSVLGIGNQQVRVCGAELTSNIEREGYFVSDPNRRIGHLGIHIESDYKLADKPFPALSDCIDIGRYGPFRVEDRKTDEMFSLKNFILSFEPTEWDFDVEEELQGRLQIIDITDDATGRPHDIAKRNIPMYVNEVGYNNTLKQNVYICDEDDRVVKYFFRPEAPMRQGDTVELLTNYRSNYEGIRERKGYGWRNLHEGVSGDDSLSHRLERNFFERRDIQTIISMEGSIQNLCNCSIFIYEKMWRPNIAKIKAFLETENWQSSQLSCTQWIAIRRMQWVMMTICQKLSVFDTATNLLNKMLVFNHGMRITSMRESAFDMNCFHTRKISDDVGKSVNTAMVEELVEETCFYLHEELPMLLDTSVYCPIAVELIKKLSLLVSQSFCYFSRRDNDKEYQKKKVLCNLFYEEAKMARHQVVQAIAVSSNQSDIIFTSGVKKKSRLCCPLVKAFELLDMSSMFFLDNTVVSKGFRAAVLDKIAYYDSLSLGDVESHWNDTIDPIEISDSIVMVKYSSFSGYEEVSVLGSAPRSMEKAKQTGLSINMLWYVVWQVFYPVHVFAKKFIDESIYSVKDLCELIGVPLVIGEFAIKRGMIKENDEVQMKHNQLILQCCRQLHQRRRIIKKKTKYPTNGLESKRSMPTKARSVAILPNVRTPNVNPTDVKTPKTKSTFFPRNSAKLVYEGPVTSFAPGLSSVGWTQKVYERGSGASKGHKDIYWFTPINQYKLRSFLEIKRYFDALVMFNGDETKAFRSRHG